MYNEEAFLDSLVPIWLPKFAQGDPEYLLIQAPYDQDSPDHRYATLQVISDVSLGHLDEGLIYNLGQNVMQDVDVTVRIQTFGKGAVSTAENFRRILEYPSMVDKMHGVKAYWRSSGTVTNLTGLIKTNYQDRASFDVVIGIRTQDFDEDILPIEKAVVELSTVTACDVTTETLRRTLTIP